MKRRKFIKTVGSIAGTVTFGGHILFISCTNEISPYNELFSKTDVRFLNELADIIIPPTSTPGGKEAKVGEFMALVIKDCYPVNEQAEYIEAMEKINSKCQDEFGKPFLDCDKIQRSGIAEEMNNAGNEYFRLLKELIVSGYLSSEIGKTQFLEYHPVPGRYDGCTSQRPW
ncbi:MAG: gluconate 2-dehydrogenase subunit 3 family protein [Balneolaceae bacterium]